MADNSLALSFIVCMYINEMPIFLFANFIVMRYSKGNGCSIGNALLPLKNKQQCFKRQKNVGYLQPYKLQCLPYI